ncbi:MAG: DUF2274 domain-containing protein [Sphingomonas sp.]
MPYLKLAKLADRTPVKIAISVTPDLHRLLNDYAAAYLALYGTSETVADLIPHMLQAFLDGDKAFVRARQSQQKA